MLGGYVTGMMDYINIANVPLGKGLAVAWDVTLCRLHDALAQQAAPQTAGLGAPTDVLRVVERALPQTVWRVADGRVVAGLWMSPNGAIEIAINYQAAYIETISLRARKTPAIVAAVQRLAAQLGCQAYDRATRSLVTAVTDSTSDQPRPPSLGKPAIQQAVSERTLDEVRRRVAQQERLAAMLRHWSSQPGRMLRGADPEALRAFSDTALARGVPLAVVKELSALYEVCDGMPTTKGLEILGCQDAAIFTWWDRGALWLGAIQGDVLLWRDGRYRLSSEGITTGSEETFTSLVDLLARVMSGSKRRHKPASAGVPAGSHIAAAHASPPAPSESDRFVGGARAVGDSRGADEPQVGDRSSTTRMGAPGASTRMIDPRGLRVPDLNVSPVDQSEGFVTEFPLLAARIADSWRSAEGSTRAMELMREAARQADSGGSARVDGRGDPTRSADNRDSAKPADSRDSAKSADNRDSADQMAAVDPAAPRPTRRFFGS